MDSLMTDYDVCQVGCLILWFIIEPIVGMPKCFKVSCRVQFHIATGQYYTPWIYSGSACDIFQWIIMACLLKTLSCNRLEKAEMLGWTKLLFLRVK